MNDFDFGDYWEASIRAQLHQAQEHAQRRRIALLRLRLAAMKLRRPIDQTGYRVTSTLRGSPSALWRAVRGAPGLVRSRRTRNLLLFVAGAAVLFDLVVASIRVEASLQQNLELIRDTFAASAQVAGILVLGIALVLLVLWLSGSEDGMHIMPFEDATGPEKRFTAIADALAAEISRIRDRHQGSLPGAAFETSLSKLPAWRTRGEDLSAVANVATVGLGDAKVSVGSVLLALKRAWPVGANATVIGGSLQRYGSTVRLVARIEGTELAAVAAQGAVQRDEDLLPLIRELAFRIVMRIAHTEATDWRAFMHYSDAHEAYAEYLALKSSAGPATDGVTTDPAALAALERAREACLRARSQQRTYQLPVELLYTLGSIFYAQHSLPHAEELYRNACDLDPNAPVFGAKGRELLASATNGLGNVWWDQERWAEAASAFQRASFLAPAATGILHNVALALEKLEQWDSALDALDRAKHLNHVGPADAYRRAVCLWKLGNEEFVAAFKEAAESAENSWYQARHPEFASVKGVYCTFGNALRHQHRYADAVEAYRKSLESGPEEPVVDTMAHVGLAGAFRKLGDSAAVEAELQCLRNKPAALDDYNQACLEVALSNIDKALPLLGSGLDKKQSTRQWAAQDPDFEIIREDPRFVALVHSNGGPGIGPVFAGAGGEVF